MERKRSNFPNEVYFKCQRCGKQVTLHEGDYISYDEKKHIYLCDDCASIEHKDTFKKLLEKYKPDEIDEMVNYSVCNKCGRRISIVEQRYAKMNADGKLILHCIECGPITNRNEKLKQEKKENKKMVKDNVNSPSHYTDGKIEVIDYIEDKKLNYHRGNAIKYISRAGKKDKKKEIEDLQKAVWYLNREINRLKQAN